MSLPISRSTAHERAAMSTREDDAALDLLERPHPRFRALLRRMNLD